MKGNSGQYPVAGGFALPPVPERANSVRAKRGPQGQGCILSILGLGFVAPNFAFMTLYTRPIVSIVYRAMARVLLAAVALVLAVAAALVRGEEDGNMVLVDPKKLEMFVDELPSMPKLDGFRVDGTKLLPGSLTVGMFEKTWKFHRDLPPTPVFAYGTSKETATVPGPTIEAVQGVPTYVTWQNHLPSRHILPWDPTIPTAVPVGGGIPTVVHLHGGIQPPTSDGNAQAWFTANFNSTGATFNSPTYTYPNVQEPGNLWYHDHAMGLTRVNLLAGLIGAYTVRNPAAESPLCLPSGDLFDRHLVLFDRSFRTDGSLYMNSTGDNPSIHPQWQPEYFGDAIIVNGKAWPYLRVHRRRYRFRIINASNARFFRLFFTNGLHFTHIGSDSTYLAHPVPNRKFLLAPSEIADVVVDFAESKTGSAVLANDSPYPYPTGDPVDDTNGIVMKFIVSAELEKDESRVPKRLLRYQAPANPQTAEMERYIVMYEYESRTGDPTHLYINGKSYEEAVTETPREGSSEVWNVINLTEDNHPLHIHLGLFVVLEQRELKDLEGFKACMVRENDARRCRVEEYAVGAVHPVPRQERGWKNVFKMGPGRVTRILVRFAMFRPGVAYPFNATAEPGYVYHCHILDHEDNAMMRPLKIMS